MLVQPPYRNIIVFRLLVHSLASDNVCHTYRDPFPLHWETNFLFPMVLRQSINQSRLMLIHNSQSIMMVLNHLPSPTHDALTLRGHNRAGNSLTNFLVYCQWAIFTRPRLAHEVVQIDGIIFGWLHMVQKSGIQKDVLSPTVISALLFGHFWRCRSLGLSMQDTCTGLLYVYIFMI